ncbi:hypothetical protein [Agrobacterium fabrum]|nr:hypothetical protein [Agrobacterium fabrum]
MEELVMMSLCITPEDYEDFHFGSLIGLVVPLAAAVAVFFFAF